jgi:hypothetical protein
MTSQALRAFKLNDYTEFRQMVYPFLFARLRQKMSLLLNSAASSKAPGPIHHNITSERLRCPRNGNGDTTLSEHRIFITVITGRRAILHLNCHVNQRCLGSPDTKEAVESSNTKGYGMLKEVGTPLMLDPFILTLQSELLHKFYQISEEPPPYRISTCLFCVQDSMLSACYFNTLRSSILLRITSIVRVDKPSNRPNKLNNRNIQTSSCLTIPSSFFASQTHYRPT